MIDTKLWVGADLRESMRIRAMLAKYTDLRQTGRKTVALGNTGLRTERLLGDLLHKIREEVVGGETDLVRG